MMDFLSAHLGAVISAIVVGLFALFGVLYYTTDIVERIHTFIDELIE